MEYDNVESRFETIIYIHIQIKKLRSRSFNYILIDFRCDIFIFIFWSYGKHLLMKLHALFILSLILYSCSPINKQHGYLIDDFLMSSDSISKFSEGNTTKSDIFNVMGSPSVEIYDVNNTWIYLISIKEKKLFEQDKIEFQNIFRFEFNELGVLEKKEIIDNNNINQIVFSNEKTRVIRDAYGITDQLYETFTRGE